MLSDSELAGMRATMNATMPETVQISRATRTADVLGGTTEVWNVVATVPGRVAPESVPPEEIDTGDRPTSIVRWDVVMPLGTDVTALDRLLVGARTFEVRGTNVGRTWDLDVVAHVSEIT